MPSTMKLIRFINERSGFAMVSALEQPMVTFQSLHRLFKEFLKHELRDHECELYELEEEVIKNEQEWIIIN